jgi:sulfate transport system substrate-binding protein
MNSATTELTRRLIATLFVGIAVTTLGCGRGSKGESDAQLMNVSFDASRPFYSAYNKVFVERYEREHKRHISIKQTHGGSGKQARAVIDGLEADVVTLALAQDVDALVEKAQLVNADWRARLPNSASPFTSTIVFLVRQGNPKHISDFSDLARPDIAVITPNPKTSGGARLAYLAAWTYALKQPGGTSDTARAFVRTLYSHVPVMDSGARAALTTFLERNMGDVLLAWENEALLAVNELAKNKVQVVSPALSILAEPPVAIVDRVAGKRRTTEIAEAYLNGLWQSEAQELAARNYFRPRDPTVLEKYRANFPDIALFRVEEVFESWQEVQKTHFAEGGIFDQITAKR